MDKQKYGFGEDQKYTLLLDFIEQMIKVKDFPPAEYEAARELLHAIKEHAQNNNKPQIIKRVNSLVTKNLPTVEKAKQKAIEMMADLKKFSGEIDK